MLATAHAKRLPQGLVQVGISSIAPRETSCGRGTFRKGSHAVGASAWLVPACSPPPTKWPGAVRTRISTVLLLSFRLRQPPRAVADEHLFEFGAGTGRDVRDHWHHANLF